MSSLAQEESRSISENTTWGVRKAFADGKARVAFTHFLGYDRDFVINEEEAETVRLIYKLFLSGYSLYSITKELKRQGRKTAFGYDNWSISSVQSILTNEKYKGCALLQKQFTVDFLQKKRKKNEGEVPQYFIEDHHEPIISPGTFELVQARMQRRSEAGHSYSSSSIYASKIRCAECGGWYGSKIWHSNAKCRRVVYQCNNKYGKKTGCHTPHIPEDQIGQLFLQALNQLVREKKEVIDNLTALMKTASDTSALERQREQLKREAEREESELKKFVDQNAHKAQDQAEYDRQYRARFAAYEQKLASLNEVSAEIDGRLVKSESIRRLIDGLLTVEGEQTIFDGQLWCAIVDYVTVYSKDRVVFTFIGGTEVTVGF